MEPKYLTKTDVQDVTRMKKSKKCLLVVAMYYVYNKFLKKSWNLPVNFGDFQFLERSSVAP